MFMYWFVYSLNMKQLIIYGICTLFLSGLAQANPPIESLKVLDGDTIEVIHKNSDISIFRLSYIDAPEAAQASGYRAARNLHKLLNVNPSKVKYKVDFVDAFARKNVTLMVNNENINALQVKDGYAWVAHKNAPLIFQDAEYAARKFGKGLWTETDPNPPWLFRSQVK